MILYKLLKKVQKMPKIDSKISQNFHMPKSKSRESYLVIGMGEEIGMVNVYNPISGWVNLINLQNSITSNIYNIIIIYHNIHGRRHNLHGRYLLLYTIIIIIIFRQFIVRWKMREWEKWKRYNRTVPCIFGK